MKKQFRFLYRYFTTSRRWRRLINLQSVMVVIVSAVFLGTLAWTTSFSGLEHARAVSSRAELVAGQSALAPQQTESATSSKPTRTPMPPEYLYNANQTLGITLAGAMLVLIVLVGVILFLPHEQKN